MALFFFYFFIGHESSSFCRCGRNKPTREFMAWSLLSLSLTLSPSLSLPQHFKNFFFSFFFFLFLPFLFCFSFLFDFFVGCPYKRHQGACVSSSFSSRLHLGTAGGIPTKKKEISRHCSIVRDGRVIRWIRLFFFAVVVVVVLEIDFSVGFDRDTRSRNQSSWHWDYLLRASLVRRHKRQTDTRHKKSGLIENKSTFIDYRCRRSSGDWSAFCGLAGGPRLLLHFPAADGQNSSDAAGFQLCRPLFPTPTQVRQSSNDHWILCLFTLADWLVSSIRLVSLSILSVYWLIDLFTVFLHLPTRKGGSKER